MNDTFGVTYEQLQPKLSLSAGPSATKHGPNTTGLSSETAGNGYLRAMVNYKST
jgi:hypothetical protein